MEGEPNQSQVGKVIVLVESVDTCPILQYIITSFWKGQAILLDPDTPMVYGKIIQILNEIGVDSMWKGLLPIGLVELQGHHYHTIGSRRSAKRWGSTLVGKMLRATLQLWLHRNSLLHATDANGLHGMDHIHLRDAIQKQLHLGVEDVASEDHYLFEVNIHDLLCEPVDYIRGWYCDMLIARGDYQGAREEGQRSRNDTVPNVAPLSKRQKRDYTNWRNICIS